jgi:UPF0755 protein
MKKKIVFYLSAIVALVMIYISYKIYTIVLITNTNFTENKIYVFIHTDATYEEAEKIFSPYIKDMEKFRLLAQQKKYNTNVKAGRFLLKKDMSNNSIINALRQNVPLNLAFNNQERIENLAGRIGKQLEIDSLDVLQSFLNPKFLSENNLKEDNILSIFLPNSYEVFWNISADKLRDKLHREYIKFWTDARILKAKNQNLTPLQVIALASIVHKETVKADERPRVAGVYLNRLKIGMPLQADPTVIYAVKKASNNFDQVIKRVLFKDLEVDNPYNTYKTLGIPPGPIAMPDVNAIDAVLNPEIHDYIYFCASVTKFGYHEFAITSAQHNENAKKYQQWLGAQNVNR